VFQSQVDKNELARGVAIKANAQISGLRFNKLAAVDMPCCASTHNDNIQTSYIRKVLLIEVSGAACK